MADESITVDANTNEAIRKIEEWKARALGAIRTVDQTAAESHSTNTQKLQQVMGFARAAYMTVAGVSRVFGKGISSIFSSAISAGISAVQILLPILTTEMVTPGMQAQAIIGFVNLGLAIAAIATAQVAEGKVSRQLQNLNFMFHGMSNMVGMMPSW